MSGTSYNPEGEVKGLPSPQPQGVLDLAKVCALCNESVIRYEEGKYERVGEPTEAALKVLVEKIGVTAQPRSSDPAFACSQANASGPRRTPCQAILEFSRDRKSMSTCRRRLADGRSTAGRAPASAPPSCKGAPESVLSAARTAPGRRLDGVDERRRRARPPGQGLGDGRAPAALPGPGRQGATLGALADYDGSRRTRRTRCCRRREQVREIEQDMTFVGLVGIKDPARPEVAGHRAVRDGGHPRRHDHGRHEADRRGHRARDRHLRPKESVDGRSFTGAEFFALPEAERTELLTHAQSMVFCRAEPRTSSELLKHAAAGSARCPP